MNHSELSEQEKEYLKKKARIASQASRRAERRAQSARWDLNILIFLFAVLIIILILLFEDVALEIVAPIAFFGLAMVWFVGWRQGKQLYERFYDEELTRTSLYELDRDNIYEQN